MQPQIINEYEKKELDRTQIMCLCIVHRIFWTLLLLLVYCWYCAQDCVFYMKTTKQSSLSKFLKYLFSQIERERTDSFLLERNNFSACNMFSARIAVCILCILYWSVLCNDAKCFVFRDLVSLENYVYIWCGRRYAMQAHGWIRMKSHSVIIIIVVFKFQGTLHIQRMESKKKNFNFREKKKHNQCNEEVGNIFHSKG